MSANQHHIIKAGQFDSNCLFENAPLRAQKNDPQVWPVLPAPGYGFDQWFDFENHTGTAAKGSVIGNFMAVKGKIPQIYKFNLDNPASQGPL